MRLALTLTILGCGAFALLGVCELRTGEFTKGTAILFIAVANMLLFLR
jgi:hypothetical protein